MPKNFTKLIIISFLAIFFTGGCGRCTKAEPPVIKIGAIKITQAEFEEEFRNSQYAEDDTQANRKEFLDNFINRLLILKESETLGYNKDPEFLKSVEFFWRQSLVKLTLDKKIKEIAAGVRVYDKDIKEYYNAHRDDEFKGRELNQARDEIKWIVLNRKQKEAIDLWLGSLKKHSQISIDFKKLNIQE